LKIKMEHSEGSEGRMPSKNEEEYDSNDEYDGRYAHIKEHPKGIFILLISFLFFLKVELNI
jgi:hypothetical protein